MLDTEATGRPALAAKQRAKSLGSVLWLRNIIELALAIAGCFGGVTLFLIAFQRFWTTPWLSEPLQQARPNFSLRRFRV